MEQSTQTEKEPQLTPAEKRSALARDLEVNLDAVEEYLQAKEERARLKNTGLFGVFKGRYKAKDVLQNQIQPLLHIRLLRHLVAMACSSQTQLSYLEKLGQCYTSLWILQAVYWHTP